jgi:tetratricopeptide (TPR) repeat protein
LAEEQFFMGGKPVPKQFYDAGILVNQGTVLLRSNMNKEAADKLAQAVQMAPNFAEAHHNYALALAKLGKTDAALKEFQVAINLNANIDSAWLSLGGLYQSTGNLSQAIAAYQQFLTRFPQHQDAPKIANLIQSLQKESQLSSPSNSADKMQDDYFIEATRGGVSRWPADRMPIRVFIHDGVDVPGYKPAYERILKQSFDDWAKASGSLVQFRYVTAGEAEIDCYWESDGHKLNNAAESGETRASKDSKGIVHCTIRLLTMPTLPEMPITENRMRQITLHEIGHALGFTGHTTNPHDAMFFSSTVEDQWKDLSQRDANTIIRLYSQG